jgi:hypothetical protein
MIDLAWPFVALCFLGAAVWAFNAWRHPTIAETTLRGLAEKVIELDGEVGKLKLAQGLQGGVRDVVRRARG